MSTRPRELRLRPRSCAVQATIQHLISFESRWEATGELQRLICVGELQPMRTGTDGSDAEVTIATVDDKLSERQRETPESGALIGTREVNV